MQIILEKDVAPLSDLDEHEDDAIAVSTTAVRGRFAPLAPTLQQGLNGPQAVDGCGFAPPPGRERPEVQR